MRSGRIYLVNPRASAFTNSPIYMRKALYSPLAGLLAVGALIPRDRYEVVLTDENIEPVDFDVTADLVGISAMTSYAKRAYEIGDAFRARGVPVLMGGVHPSFMPTEALLHADAVVVGEAELVMARVLSDLEAGEMQGIYKADRLHPLVDLPLPRYDLMKARRYVNKTFVQTSRGCHHACAFCAEHLMNGLRFRYRPIDEVLRDIETCGSRVISLNDADFFGSPKRATTLMKALKGRGIRWQAGVDSRNAMNDDLLELAAASGCYMLSIGFESVSRRSLRSAHKRQNDPDTYHELVEKIRAHDMMTFGLFMFGFDHDDASVFEETAKFTIGSGMDVAAFSLLTPFPGTLTWYSLLEQGRIRSFDWDKYDQGHIVYQTRGLSTWEIARGYKQTYERFYSLPSLLRRFPVLSSRRRFYWTAYNLFFRKGVVGQIREERVATTPTARPEHAARPPIVPAGKAWQALVLDDA